MNPKLENKLYQIDPIFFEEAIACLNGEMNEMNTCMAFGCECGDGWFKPIKTLAMKTNMLNEAGKAYNVKFVCNQLKEKFGEIRIYASANKINPDEDFKPGWEVLDKMFHDSMSTCEIECSKVCEICGASGGYNNENIVQTTGWIRYICKKCAREQTENSTKCYDEQHKDNEFYGIDRITLFKQENEFLNIYDHYPFIFNNVTYSSIIEAYFSIVSPENKSLFKMISTGKSQYFTFIIEELGKKFEHKIDDYKLLKDIVEAKFLDPWNSSIRKDLLLTKTKKLIFMNNLHNNELGYCYCDKCKDIEKQNIYGKILMEVRDSLFQNFKEKFDLLKDAKMFVNNIGINLNIFEAKKIAFPNFTKYFVSNKLNIEVPDYTIQLLKQD